MRHYNITATCQIDNQRVLDKYISFLNMQKYTSKKIYVKASADKPLGKPPLGDKIFGIEPAIRVYDVEYRYETEKVEEAEIIVV